MTLATRTQTPFRIRPLTACFGTALALALQVASLTAVPVSAQTPGQPTPSKAPEWRSFRSEDGSEFLLLPNVQGAPAGLVHWVLATPSGPLEDPPGRPGLARAILRASIGGTSTIGTADWEEERAAMELVTTLRERIRAVEARGETAPAELQQQLNDARRNSERLGDRSIWLDRLRRAPAVDVNLEETPGTTLLHLATRDLAIPRVAALLLARRERAALRDVDRHYADVVEELRRGAETTENVLGREMTVLAFPARGTGPVPPGPPGPIPFTELLALHAELMAPAGTRHVLAGSFDPDAVESVLRTAFATSGLEDRTGRSAIGPPPSGRRAATIAPREGSVAAGLAITPPKSASPGWEEILTYYLLEGEDAPLRTQLAKIGYPGVELTIRSPFPSDRDRGLFAIFAEASTGAAAVGNLPIRTDRPPLDRAIEQCLRRILKDEPRKARWETAMLRVRADLAERKRDARSLSLWLGRDWASLRRLPTTLLGAQRPSDSNEAWDALKEAFASNLRITVRTEANR